LKTKAGALRVGDQVRLDSEVEDYLGCVIRLFFKNKTKNKKQKKGEERERNFISVPLTYFFLSYVLWYVFEHF
jgi:hypothetical protein